MTEKKKILIAEDDPDLVTLYKLMLGGGYDLIEAANGRQAVDLFKEHSPDLTLMDIKMPVMNGDEAIREIISHAPDARIVVITAYNIPRENLGAPVLRKGFSRDELMSHVEAGLQR